MSTYIDKTAMDIPPYIIRRDTVSGTPKIHWIGNELYVYSLYKDKNYKICLNFNIKDGKPCLHFRYKGFRLSLNDKVYFIYGSPFLEATVVSRPHLYEDKMKEVDFILSEEDIRSLRQNDLSRIYIKHSDGSCTLEFFVKFSQNRFFEQKEEGDKNAFKRFIKLYYKALKEAEVINAKTKMTRFENTRIQQLASALGINESQAIELFKTHLYQNTL